LSIEANNGQFVVPAPPMLSSSVMIVIRLAVLWAWPWS
jgi:hypothetical protein